MSTGIMDQSDDTIVVQHIFELENLESIASAVNMFRALAPETVNNVRETLQSADLETASIVFAVLDWAEDFVTSMQ